MTLRKKPGVAFWATVAIVAVLVGYPLSFGPACWLCDRDVLPYRLADSTYRPLVSLGVQTNCERAMEWYGSLVGLPDLPPEVAEEATDCRLRTAVRIRVGIEMERFVREHGWGAGLF